MRQQEVVVRYQFLSLAVLALRKNCSRYLDWFVYAAFAGLLFDILFSNITLILLLIASLLSLSFSTYKRTLLASAPVLTMIIFYIIHIIALLYSQNTSNGLFVLEKKISLLLLPLISFPAITSLPEKQRRDLTLGLGLVVIGSSMVFILIATAKVLLYNYTLAFHRDYFPSIPYVFYSMYFATGSLLLLEWLLGNFNSGSLRLTLLLILIVYSMGMLVVIGSKTGILAYLCGITFFLYKRIPSRKIFFLSSAIVLVVAGGLLIAYPSTLDRFTELGKNLQVVNEEKIGRQEEFTGLNLRLFFWKIGLHQLWTDKAWVAGVGTGDAQDYLNHIYQTYRLDDYGYFNFDAHSQWVTTLLQTGAIGLIILLLFFILCWERARRNNNLSLWFMAWIVFCFCFSESVLESNKGIVFVALFLAVLCGQSGGSTLQQASDTIPENLRTP